jgi:hypothetical protein
LCGGALITLLKLAEYRFLVVAHSLETYGGLVAAIFSGAGHLAGANAGEENSAGSRPAAPGERNI